MMWLTDNIRVTEAATAALAVNSDSMKVQLQPRPNQQPPAAPATDASPRQQPQQQHEQHIMPVVLVSSTLSRREDTARRVQQLLAAYRIAYSIIFVDLMAKLLLLPQVHNTLTITTTLQH